MIRTCEDRAPSWYKCTSTYALWVDGKPVGLVHEGEVRMTRDDNMRQFYADHPNWVWTKGVMDPATKLKMGQGDKGGGSKVHKAEKL